MQSFVTRLSSKYQVVIPKEVRDALGLKPHDAVIFLIDGDEVILRPKPRDFVEALRGLHKEVWMEDVDGWLEEERASWE